MGVLILHKICKNNFSGVTSQSHKDNWYQPGTCKVRMYVKKQP